ncbi:mitochondrial import inner membrane translocase subunit TIM50-A [Scaptodrosophila lebanonensis]|uniref:Mitochondrial import inner membrane translocase subunit TIM50 n=1 Tax=Drosophila lebanonensis TaxID=7225 RepID=A0A6J2TNL5_DROLE|nr:mitochondrial import inner membrane translocase subunit TIM50-A [Scaptodrosophila lebanonensis]
MCKTKFRVSHIITKFGILNMVYCSLLRGLQRQEQLFRLRPRNRTHRGRTYTEGDTTKNGPSPDLSSKPDPPPTNTSSAINAGNMPASPMRSSKSPHYGYSIALGGLCSALLWAIYELGKPERDQSGQPIEDELSMLPLAQQYIKRMWISLQYYQKMLEEPVPSKLLPDVMQAPYIQPRYTLVLEMKDVLVHPDWTYQTGWRFKKRPGVDYLLQQCSKHFEIIVYTAEQGTTVFPILDALDPNGYIRYRLVRGATQFIDGHHIKNLNSLNRNLKRVIVVDWDKNATCLHPDNTFAMARWLGNDDDVELFDLMAFLQIIAENEIDDVRSVLHYYRQFENPIQQFKENQRMLLEKTQEKMEPQRTASKRWPYSLMGGGTKH